jgi:hypothetical protein
MIGIIRAIHCETHNNIGVKAPKIICLLILQAQELKVVNAITIALIGTARKSAAELFKSFNRKQNTM